jgi:MoxR-like ATPase
MIQGEEIQKLEERIYRESEWVEKIKEETATVLVGQDKMVERLLIGLLTGGHILLEGLPGLAKTLAIKTLSVAVGGEFRRIQFTPDLLPADVIGTMIYNPDKRDFEVKKGPVFANFILADEINRSPAKVQSALLEAMQELQVTIGQHTYPLEQPFLVLATQNPIEQEGTYPLPEAQMDRFMLKVVIGYPNREEELEIMRRNLKGDLGKIAIKPVTAPETILKSRELVGEVYMDEKVEQYIVDLVFATRFPQKYPALSDLRPLISHGSSPRATISLGKASKALAFIKRRGYVVPDDVRNVARDVLRHRIGLSYEAEVDDVRVEDVVDTIVRKLEVP